MDVARMHGGKSTEPAEVRHIQREDVAYAMHVHGRRQSRVVHLNTQDAVLHNNSPPFPVNGFAVRQNGHTGLDCSDLALSLGNGQSKPVAGKRARHRIPEFSNILVGVMESNAL
jgi:hypothetical protein